MQDVFQAGTDGDVDEARRLQKGSRVLPVRTSSSTGLRYAARLLAKRRLFEGRPRLIYLDAAHEYPETLHEMRLAWQLLPPGGFLVGDDFDSSWPGVQWSLNEFIAERRPSEMNPPRHTESGGAAAGSDASTFGAQVSQSAQTTRKAERDAAPKETATSSPEQSAGKAANAQSSPAQTAAKPSQTDQVAGTNVNGQTSIAPSTTPQTGNTDTAQPGGSPGDSDANGSSRPDLLTTGSDDTEAVPTPATIKSDNSLSATSPLNSGPAQDHHVPHSSANVSTVQPEKAARAIPQVPDMAEGDSAATQQLSAGGDPKL